MTAIGKKNLYWIDLLLIKTSKVCEYFTNTNKSIEKLNKETFEVSTIEKL